MLVAICNAFSVVASTSFENQEVFSQAKCGKQIGNTLITDYQGLRVIEVDSDGFTVWQKTGLNAPFDAERLANGNTLISELGGRVIEVELSGNIVWQYSAVSGPSDAERLANGNTLICDLYDNRVIEVDVEGFVVWELTDLNWPVDAERLINGHTLITEIYSFRVIEVDSSGTILWQKTGLNDPMDAERLDNGNTLIADAENYRVIEIESGGNIVWQFTSSGMLIDAERLSNGNTLMTEAYYGNRVIEVDSSGTIVWEKDGLSYPVDVERLSNPPSAPTINGPASGKPGKEYDYTFNSVDPDDDDVKFFINWDDGSTEWTDYSPSGSNLIVKHTWSEKGNYTIEAKAVDINGVESDLGTFEVTIPRNKPFSSYLNLFKMFIKRSFNLFTILRYIQ